MRNLSGPRLFDVTQSTLVARMLYGSPVWYGYINENSKKRLNSVINRARKLAYLPKKFETFDNLCEHNDQALFSEILKNEYHVLHRLLPEKKLNRYNFRQRVHNRSLPIAANIAIKNGFINRMLFKDCY
mgnify:CR=1 FL=1